MADRPPFQVVYIRQARKLIYSSLDVVAPKYWDLIGETALSAGLEVTSPSNLRLDVPLVVLLESSVPYRLRVPKSADGLHEPLVEFFSFLEENNFPAILLVVLAQNPVPGERTFSLADWPAYRQRSGLTDATVTAVEVVSAPDREDQNRQARNEIFGWVTRQNEQQQGRLGLALAADSAAETWAPQFGMETDNMRKLLGKIFEFLINPPLPPAPPAPSSKRAATGETADGPPVTKRLREAAAAAALIVHRGNVEAAAKSLMW